MFKRASPFLCWDWMKDFLLQRLFLLNRRQSPLRLVSFHYYLHTLLTNLYDCHVARLQGGVDGCRAILTDGRACLGAIDAIYADLLALVLHQLW